MRRPSQIPPSAAIRIVACLSAVLAALSCGYIHPRVETVAGIEMVVLPAGTFEMGSLRGETDERPPHMVSLRSFQIGSREITQAMYATIMGENQAAFTGDDLPIENVSWFDAVRFCNRLSDIAGFEHCYDEESWECDFEKNGFRLPTEAEWEYACRARTGVDRQKEAWRAGTLDDRELLGTQKTPNRWGLYDMYGTEWEWCHDWYGADYYTASPGISPAGALTDTTRVVRGGGWYLYADNERAADREHFVPDHNGYNVSFRVARTVNR